MTKLMYSTELTIQGPWFLDADSLLRLDYILDEENRNLLIYRDKKVDRDAKEYVNTYQSKLSDTDRAEKIANLKKEYLEEIDRYEYKYGITREINVSFANGQTIVAESFNKILRDRSATDALPTLFNLDMKCCDIHCNIALKKYHDDSLNINVSPEGVEEAIELFVILRQWAQSNYAPSWQRMWLKITSYFPFHWIAWGVVLWVAFLTMIYEATSPAEEMIMTRAHQLIDSGISNTNMQEAIETLLMLHTKCYPGLSSSSSMIFPGWVKAWTVIGLIVCIILSVKPSVIIGIGKGS
jgi:hypothetical protein